MARRKKTMAAHPGEILRTEFMEPLGITLYQLAKALHLPGMYEFVRGSVPFALTLCFAWVSTSA